MAMMVDRVTFIHPDGATEVTAPGHKAFDASGRLAVKIPAVKVPDWVQPGADVVAAFDDGTVACAFTVDTVNSTVEPPPPGGRRDIEHLILEGS